MHSATDPNLLLIPKLQGSLGLLHQSGESSGILDSHLGPRQSHRADNANYRCRQSPAGRSVSLLSRQATCLPLCAQGMLLWHQRGNCAEKEKLRKLLSKHCGRVCLTTDTWTSLQNQNYMCLIAHFIDKDWRLHKQVLNFQFSNLIWGRKVYWQQVGTKWFIMLKHEAIVR